MSEVTQAIFINKVLEYFNACFLVYPEILQYFFTAQAPCYSLETSLGFKISSYCVFQLCGWMSSQSSVHTFFEGEHDACRNKAGVTSKREALFIDQ